MQHEVPIADVIDLPFDWLQSVGFPSFDEFKKDPDKWRNHSRDLLDHVDNANIAFKNVLAKTQYTWRGEYKTNKLEEIERIAKNEGFNLGEIEMQPRVQPVHGTAKDGPVEIVIHFWPRDEFRFRGGIVANDL